MSRTWVLEAIRKIECDFQRSADTHLIKIDLPVIKQNIQLYLKDESTHPTGSLKHRLARSLFLYSLCNGWIDDKTTVIEASSGSTAVSEAYFARLLGLPFIAVMPESTSGAKIDQIALYGGQSHLVDNPSDVYIEAERLAQDCSGHYMDQFTYAERATDWRGNNNIAESIYRQMHNEENPIPRWIIVGAGTGGTSATIGRYIRYCCYNTKLCVVDPDNSVFYDYYHCRDISIVSEQSSGIEGIGRPRVEPSFIPDVVDRMIRVPNDASYAAMRFLEHLQGQKYGASTGTNLYGALKLVKEMTERGEEGSAVTLACDPGNRYLTTYFDDEWLADNGYDIEPYMDQLTTFFENGRWP